MNDSYFSKNFNQRIEIGIGVHAGTVIAGNIRLGNEKKLLVMGYPVNVAARLQNATKELNNNFIISSEALKLTGKPLSGHPSSIVHLRGIEEPITVHYSESHMKMVFYKVFINLQFFLSSAPRYAKSADNPNWSQDGNSSKNPTSNDV